MGRGAGGGAPHLLLQARYQGADVAFLVVPDSATNTGEVAGMFGMASLRGYDIELNLAQHWINLFS